MFRIDGMSRTPVYEQIIEQIEKLVSLGIISPGEQLPSVRSLSIELSVNPNTIQKAYSELDAKGIVHSVPGKGCFVSEHAADFIAMASRRKIGELTEAIRSLALSGVTKEEILNAVEEAFLPHEK
ncbi:MAG: GntR family transcriptional regulator [Clostridia bacterium]|nr:GntR family transcriptional regulator [Clostridia bacterium]